MVPSTTEKAHNRIKSFTKWEFLSVFSDNPEKMVWGGATWILQNIEMKTGGLGSRFWGLIALKPDFQVVSLTARDQRGKKTLLSSTGSSFPAFSVGGDDFTTNVDSFQALAEVLHDIIEFPLPQDCIGALRAVTDYSSAIQSGIDVIESTCNYTSCVLQAFDTSGYPCSLPVDDGDKENWPRKWGPDRAGTSGHVLCPEQVESDHRRKSCFMISEGSAVDNPWVVVM